MPQRVTLVPWPLEGKMPDLWEEFRDWKAAATDQQRARQVDYQQLLWAMNQIDALRIEVTRQRAEIAQLMNEMDGLRRYAGLIKDE